MPEIHIEENTKVIREEWIERLNQLVDDVETWGKSLEWTTRRIDKPMKDSVVGPYQAPGLLMQREFTRILLDPISRLTPGSEGLVDLYLMPAFDDIASLYFFEDRWNIQYRLSNIEGAETVREMNSLPLTRDSLAEVLDGMARHAA